MVGQNVLDSRPVPDIAAAAFQVLPVPSLLLAPDAPRFTVLDANAAYLGTAGVSREDLLGRGLLEVLPDDPGQAGTDGGRSLRASLAAVLDTATPDRMEAQPYPVRHRDGGFSGRWWRIVNTPVPGPGTAVAAILHTVEDVDERRRAEGRLRTSDTRLARLLDMIPAGVAELNAEGQVTYANAAAERIAGAQPGGMTGLRHDSGQLGITAADGSGIPFDRLPGAWALRGEAVVDYELAFTALDGRRVVVLVDVVPVRDDAGRVTGALAAFQDVTARHAAVRALQESELRFRGFVENSTDVLWIVDAGTGRLEHLSTAYERIWGEPRDRIMADLAHWAETVHPDDRAEGATVLPRVLAGETFTIEYRVVRRDGGVRWLRDTGFPIRGADGSVQRVGGIAQDVTVQKEAQAALQRANETLEARVSERTAALLQALGALHAEASERERAEAALRQSQKMEAVGQLTGGIAHDFNNMLQAISGSLELMRRRVEQGRAEQAASLVDAARRTVDRAAALTNRLLAFARRQALQPEPVEPDTLVKGMAELIRRTAGPSITVELRPRDGVWSVLCDPNQLENALLNLAINARDAMAQPAPGAGTREAGARPDGGTLTIATADVHLSASDVAGHDGAQPGDYVEIQVADTGAGMDEATRARAFEPFFTTKPIGQGTGLGLSQLYGFVQQSGGVVRLDSAPGQGTTVRVYLPRHTPVQPGQDGSAPAPRPEGARAGQTVLLVEDEPEVRAVAAEHLRDLGYDVLEAEDGSAALRLLRTTARLDVLVTDVGLPGGLNGRQIADAAREARPGLPVLFITGYAGDALDDRLAAGMEVIGKPFTLDALAARVRRMADGRLPEG